MRRPFNEICQIAKKASVIDYESDSGYNDLRFLALEKGMKKDSLMYYTNAYEASGESGVRALSYRKPLPENEKIEAEELVNKFLQSRIPKNRPNELWFGTVTRHNRITTSERRPLFSDPSKSSTSEIFQLRYTDYDDRWHLYWKRASGKWWPYVPKKVVKTVKDCLREISEDSHGCFWG